MLRECSLELKSNQSHSLVSTEPYADIELVLDPTKFSTLSRLIGVTVKVLRALQRFKDLKSREAISHTANPVEEYVRAELLWVKSAQSKLSNLEVLTKRFNLFKDENRGGFRGLQPPPKSFWLQ